MPRRAAVDGALPGIIFCLRAEGEAARPAADAGYPLAPHYLVHVGDNGTVLLPYTQAKHMTCPHWAAERPAKPSTQQNGRDRTRRAGGATATSIEGGSLKSSRFPGGVDKLSPLASIWCKVVHGRFEGV
jgi:hypothetical protein